MKTFRPNLFVLLVLYSSQLYAQVIPQFNKEVYEKPRKIYPGKSQNNVFPAATIKATTGDKLGYLNVNKLVDQLASKEGIDVRIEKYQDSLHTQYQFLVEQWEQKNALVNTPDSIKLNASVRSKIRTELEALNFQISNWYSLEYDLIQKKQAELLNPIYRKVTQTTEAVAREKGYATVFNSESLVFANTQDDIMTLACNKLNLPIPEVAGNTAGLPGGNLKKLSFVSVYDVARMLAANAEPDSLVYALALSTIRDVAKENGFEKVLQGEAIVVGPFPNDLLPLIARKMNLPVAAAKAVIYSQVEDGKTGYIDFDYIVNKLPEVKEAEISLQRFEKDSLDPQYEFLVQEYNNRAAMLSTKDSIKLSARVRQNLHEEIEYLGSKIQSFEQFKQETIQAKATMLWQPINARVIKAVEIVAKEKGYSTVLHKESLIVGTADGDLSSFVVKKIL